MNWRKRLKRRLYVQGLARTNRGMSDTAAKPIRQQLRPRTQHPPKWLRR